MTDNQIKKSIQINRPTTINGKEYEIQTTMNPRYYSAFCNTTHESICTRATLQTAYQKVMTHSK
jgi:hypothetical protein